jgi:hypothetical protein
MKRFTLLSAMLLVGSVAYAQAPDNTSRPAQNPDANSQSNDTSRSSTTGGRKMTMTGCVMEHNGKYVLMTNKHSAQSSENPRNEPSNPQYGSNEQSGTSGRRSVELVGNQDELKQHVGHTIKVTGTMERSSAVSSDTGDTNTPPDRSSDTSQNRSTSEHKRHGAFRVSDIQMVSETCAAGNTPGSQPR